MRIMRSLSCLLLVLGFAAGSRVCDEEESSGSYSTSFAIRSNGKCIRINCDVVSIEWVYVSLEDYSHIDVEAVDLYRTFSYYNLDRTRTNFRRLLGPVKVTFRSTNRIHSSSARFKYTCDDLSLPPGPSTKRWIDPRKCSWVGNEEVFNRAGYPLLPVATPPALSADGSCWRFMCPENRGYFFLDPLDQWGAEVVAYGGAVSNEPLLLEKLLDWTEFHGEPKVELHQGAIPAELTGSMMCCSHTTLDRDDFLEIDRYSDVEGPRGGCFRFSCTNSYSAKILIRVAELGDGTLLVNGVAQPADLRRHEVEIQQNSYVVTEVFFHVGAGKVSGGFYATAWCNPSAKLPPSPLPEPTSCVELVAGAGETLEFGTPGNRLENNVALCWDLRCPLKGDVVLHEVDLEPNDKAEVLGVNGVSSGYSGSFVQKGRVVVRTDSGARSRGVRGSIKCGPASGCELAGKSDGSVTIIDRYGPRSHPHGKNITECWVLSCPMGGVVRFKTAVPGTSVRFDSLEQVVSGSSVLSFKEPTVLEAMLEENEGFVALVRCTHVPEADGPPPPTVVCDDVPGDKTVEVLNYTDNEASCWVLRCPKGQIGTTVLHSYDTEPGYDILEVGNVALSGKMQDGIEHLRQISDNGLKVTFLSDNSGVTGRGFKLQHTCGGCAVLQAVSDEETLTLDYFDGYRSNIEPCWVFECPLAGGVLEFRAFDLELGFDYLNVTTGGTTYFLSGQHLPSSVPFGRFLTLQMYTDARINLRGFRAVATCNFTGTPEPPTPLPATDVPPTTSSPPTEAPTTPIPITEAPPTPTPIVDECASDPCGPGQYCLDLTQDFIGNFICSCSPDLTNPVSNAPAVC